MSDLIGVVNAIADASAFSGVVHISRGTELEFAAGYGLSDRSHLLPNTVETRFGIASGTKGLTALVIASLISDGMLNFETRARVILGSDLPLIDDRVTIGELLAHRSGIGDYFSEASVKAITDYPLSIPVNRLVDTEDFLQVLDGFPQLFTPGARFEYSNSGFVVLALIAERVTGESFADLVAQRVCEPAGMIDTEFLRSDSLPGDVAIGYLFDDLTDLRSNVFHLPMRGSGDGGIYSTAADFAAFWSALFQGAIVDTDLVEQLVRPQSLFEPVALEYGQGFWYRPEDNVVLLEGYDAGVSFRSWHRRETSRTVTVLSNTSEGVWPVAKAIATLG